MARSTSARRRGVFGRRGIADQQQSKRQSAQGNHRAEPEGTRQTEVKASVWTSLCE